jgi:hypothetical protein
MDLSEQFNSSVNQVFSVIDSNRVLSTVLGLFLALYAALAAPVLPMSVTKIFKNTWFRLAFMFLIAYLATKDPSVAIISAVALLVTLQTLSAQETTNAVVRAVEKKVDSNREAFADVEPAISTDRYSEISDYAPVNASYEILPNNFQKDDKNLKSTDSDSDKARKVQATQYVLNDQVNMNNYVAKSETASVKSSDKSSDSSSEAQTEEEEEEGEEEGFENEEEEYNEGVEGGVEGGYTEGGYTEGVEGGVEQQDESLMGMVLNGFENVQYGDDPNFEPPVEDGIEPFTGDIQYEFNSNDNNGMGNINIRKHNHESFENQKTTATTGTCGDASAAVPGFDTTEFATF